MPGNVEAVFFDAGGTLIHAKPSVGEVYSRITGSLGVPIAAGRFEELFLEAWNQYVGRIGKEPLPLPVSDADDRAMWRRISRMVYDWTPELHAIEYSRWFDTLYGTFTTSAVWQPYEEVPEVLEKLSGQGYLLGVVSNWSSYLRAILTDLGIARYMRFLVISADIGFRKPDRQIFERAGALAGVPLGRCLHVGDTFEDDYAGAERAGLVATLLNRKGSDGLPSRRAGLPVSFIRSLRELSCTLQAQ